MGWPPPKPKSPVEILAREISEAARLEERTDKVTGIPYRANLSYSVAQGNGQMTQWVDVEEATKPQLAKSMTNGREQLVGEMFRMAMTAEHWSRINPDEEPYELEMDLGPDVEWRRHAPGGHKKAS